MYIHTFSIYLSRLLNKNLSVLKFNLSSFTVTEIEKQKQENLCIYVLFQVELAAVENKCTLEG